MNIKATFYKHIVKYYAVKISEKEQKKNKTKQKYIIEKAKRLFFFVLI